MSVKLKQKYEQPGHEARRSCCYFLRFDFKICGYTRFYVRLKLNTSAGPWFTVSHCAALPLQIVPITFYPELLNERYTVLYAYSL